MSTNLTPRTELALWRLFINSEGRDSDGALRHYRELLDANAGMLYATASNHHALRNRGLVEGQGYDTRLTDAGRAWIAEQIDIARDEAGLDVRQATDESNQRMRWYRRHHNCTHEGMVAAIDCDHANALRANIGLSRPGPEQDRAIREAQRADCVAVSLPALLDDWTEALAMESVRRGGCGRVILATAVAGVDMCTAETPCASCVQAIADAKVDPLMAIIDATTDKSTVTHLAAVHERNDGIACEGWYYPRGYQHMSTAVYGDVTCPACIGEVTFLMDAAGSEPVCA